MRYVIYRYYGFQMWNWRLTQVRDGSASLWPIEAWNPVPQAPSPDLEARRWIYTFPTHGSFMGLNCPETDPLQLKKILISASLKGILNSVGNASGWCMKPTFFSFLQSHPHFRVQLPDLPWKLMRAFLLFFSWLIILYHTLHRPNPHRN